MIKLTITEKGGDTKALSFEQNEVMIGRVQGNDIVLAKGNISKRHTKIELSAGQLTVSDMKSTNGTYVNGRKIAEPTAVRGGDKIFVGDFLIVLDPGAPSERTASGARRMPGPPPPPPPPPPPRAGRRPGAEPEPRAEDASEIGDLGLPGDRPPPTGSGRPLAPPPPPPPRPTIATSSLSALEDDGVDLGLDEPPPSPAEVGAVGESAFGDSLGDLVGGGESRADDVEADSGAEDVFGSTNAEDEDAGRAPISVVAASPVASAEPAPESRTPPPAPPAPRRSERHERLDSPSRQTSANATLTLETLLDDATVTAIIVTPGAPVEIERDGKLEAIGEIGDRNMVAESLWQLANTATPPPPADNPVVEVRLPDGARLTALFPPMTSAPVCATIRKAAVREVALGDLAGGGDVETLLAAALASRRNILVAGDAQAAGSLMAALTAAIPSDRRVVSIGVPGKARAGWVEIAPVGDPAGLLSAATAFRPQHLLVAGQGGAELADVLAAIARGQEGVIACIGARSAAEALGRLRAFSINALGAAAFTTLVTNTLDLVVFAANTASGIRVVEIAEPQVEGDGLVPAFVARRPENNRASLVLDVPGVSKRLAAAIAVAADGLPTHLVRQ